MNRRMFIGAGVACAGSAVLAVEEKTADGGYAPVSWADRQRRDVPVLPPGAHSAAAFAKKCVACGLCAAACPTKCLRPSEDPRRFGRVELDFRHGWCKPSCTRCGEVCPSGAIGKVPYVGKHLVHVGVATLAKDLCLRLVEKENCHACEKHCPHKAVTLVGDAPVVDALKCTGCGACEHYCPVRPVTAIRVVGYERHREVGPIDEADLIAEMRVVLDTGKAAVVAKDGVIVRAPEGRGVKPMLELLDREPAVLKGSLVLDRVCGRASAAICIVGGVRKVVSPVMAAGAKALLEKHGVAAEAGKVVETILNHDRTGGCPMDARCADIDDPAAIVRAIR